MKEALDKISSYNLFNYLLPGVLFAIFAKSFLSVDLIKENIVLDVFLYYFVGLIISRFGSLIIEPILKKVNFLSFGKYEDFINASKKDSSIEILSEANNMYRTFTAMFVLLLISKLYFYIQTLYPYLRNHNVHALVVLLLMMFLYSYKKQTRYIVKRINIIKT